MKISREKLLKALNLAAKVTPKGEHMAILKTVKISGPDQKLYVTNFDIYLAVDLPIEDWRTVTMRREFDPAILPKKKPDLLQYAEQNAIPNITAKMSLAELRAAITEFMSDSVVIEESYCLNSGDLRKIVSSLEVDTVEIVPSSSRNLIGSRLVAIGGHFQNLPTYELSDFPSWPAEFDTEEISEVSTENLDNVARAASVGDSQMLSLGCVFFDADHGRIVATDGSRLHFAPATSNVTWLLKGEVIRFCNAVSKGGMKFMLNEDKSMAKFIFDGGRAYLRAGEGKFPDYTVLLSDMEPESWVEIKVQDLLRAARQALIMTDQNVTGMKMTVNGSLQLEVNHPEKGQYQRVGIPLHSGEIEGEVEIGLNAKYFSDVVEIVSKKKDDKEETILRLGIKNPETGVQFKKGEEFFAIVMPMRL